MVTLRAAWDVAGVVAVVDARVVLGVGVVDARVACQQHIFAIVQDQLGELTGEV